MAHGKSPRHERRSKRSVTKPALVAGGLSTDDARGMRVQKLLAAAGFASRRGAEAFVRDGRVTVNGKVVELGARATPGRDVVALDGERLSFEPRTYWVAHKPRGMLTTSSDPHGRRTVTALIPDDLPRLFAVGRLDLDTSGLILLTNDGEMAHRLLHPSLGNEREYRVTVRGELGEGAQGKLARGVRLEEGKTFPAQVGDVRYDGDADATTLHLILTEGRKRQIRRTMLVLGHPVKRLVRIRFGPLRLGRLPAGRARPLRDDELRALRKHVGQLEARPPSRR